MSADQVALILRCAECEARWLPADEERCVYCPECAEREFGRS